jgi:hypothetical protein
MHFVSRHTSIRTGRTSVHYWGGGWNLSQSFNMSSTHIPDDCLTREEGGHQTQEGVGKAHLAEIREGGNRGVHLACQVARTALVVSQRPEVQLSIQRSFVCTVSDNRSRLKISECRTTIRTGWYHSHSTPGRHPATRASRKL